MVATIKKNGNWTEFQGSSLRKKRLQGTHLSIKASREPPDRMICEFSQELSQMFMIFLRTTKNREEVELALG